MLKDVVGIAQDAGRKIMDVYADESAWHVEQKSDDSPLTQADLASHHFIEDALLQLFPDIPFLSEESACVDFSVRQSWSRYWLVDPLDGTKEFIKRNDEFTVNIALIDNGVSVLGVVDAPALGMTYFAEQGGGAFVQKAGDVSRIEVVEVRDPLKVVASRSHGNERMVSVLACLGRYESVPVGSSLKMCYVAEGVADLYLRLGLTSEWDTAAAQCVVEEAGGQLCTLDFLPMRYNHKDSLLNPEFIVFGDSEFPWQDRLKAVL